MSLMLIPEGAVRQPPIGWALAEPYRATASFLYSSLLGSFLNQPALGDGHPVLVLPGFSADDQTTATLRAYLRRLGYETHGWELGRNLGPRSLGADGTLLSQRICEIFASTGQKVSLVGWSLGGLMAREAAQLHPELVRQVITLGSPVMGDPRGTLGWQLYEQISGHSLSSDEAKRQLEKLRRPLSVPSTSIYSQSDGVVSWEDCQQAPAEQAENIEVDSSHWGLVCHADVLYLIGERLAQPDGHWQPYNGELA